MQATLHKHDAGRRPKNCYTNTSSNSQSSNKDMPMVIDNENSKINYFLPDPNQDNVMRVSAETTQQLWRDLKGVFTRIRDAFVGHSDYR